MSQTTTALGPGVTVIVRTIGRMTLAAALESVTAQGRDDVAILVVDARGLGAAGLGSSWVPPGCATPTVVSLGRALHRSESAQAGLDAVATRHAIFLDDDDLFLPGHLDKLLRALAAAPDAVAAYTGVELVEPGPPPQPRGVFDQPFAPWELLLGNRIPIHAVLFDVARARAAGAAFDRSLDVYEDWDFWLQLALLGPFVHVPGISARYHVHAQASQVHQLQHGDEPFWRIWRKWWPRAPQAWWNDALHQREVAVGLGGELAASRAHGEHLAAQLREREAQVRDREARWREAVDQWQLTVANLKRTEQELHARAEALAWTEAALAAERREVAERDRRLAEAAAEQHRLGAALIEAQWLAAHLRDRHAAVDVQRRRLLDEVAALRASPSWRVTAPLRVASAKAQALRRRAGDWRRRLGWTPRAGAYRRWIDEVEAPLVAERHAAITPLLQAPRPLVSVLMPVFEPQRSWLDEAIESLRGQTWPHWELCLVDDGSAQPGLGAHLAGWREREARVRLACRASNGGIAAATNDALALARGEWVLLLDQDDRLAPQALAEVVLAVHAHPQAELIYSDEDKLDASGRRVEPHFKGRFSVERLRGQNFINHLVAARRDRVSALGGWRAGFDGAQDHELLLRATEQLGAGQIHHIPQVLYHWRAAPGSTAASTANKADALQAALRAVNESLARAEPGAAAEGLPFRHWLRVRYPVPQPRPAVQGYDAHAGDDAPLVLIRGHAVEPTGDGWFDELLSLVTRPGIAVVGGVLTDAAGRWRDAARDHAEARSTPGASDARWPLIPAAFGRRDMVQDADCVPAALLVMTRAAHTLWLAQGLDADADTARMGDFCAAVRASVGRVLWTPFASARRA